MSCWTPGSTKGTPRSPPRDSDSDVSSTPRRVPAAETGIHGRDMYDTARCERYHKKSTHDVLKEEGVVSEPARRACEPQSQVELLRRRLAQADAKYSALNAKFQESSRLSQQLLAEAREQAGKLSELEARYIVESQRSKDLEAEAMQKKVALEAAENQIFQLKGDLNAKGSAIQELEEHLARECQSHQDTKERVYCILKQHEALAAQVHSGFANSEALPCSSLGHSNPQQREPENVAPAVGSGSEGGAEFMRGPVECGLEGQMVEYDAQELAILRDQLEAKHNQLLMVQDELEGYVDEVDRQLVAARQEIKNEKLRSRMLQEKLDAVRRARRHSGDGRQVSSPTGEKSGREQEEVLGQARAKAARLRSMAKSALAVVTSKGRRMTMDEVQALESLLADAAAISDSLVQSCTGQLSDALPVSGVPAASEPDWHKTGVPGLQAMVEELRCLQQPGRMGVGHNNPKQKIQYHIRLKQELEEMRKEFTKLMREKWQLEQCIRYLAARCHLYQGFCVGEDLCARTARRSADSARSRVVASTLCPTEPKQSPKKRAARHTPSTKGPGANKKKRTVSESNIHDVQLETLQEAAALLSEMAKVTDEAPCMGPFSPRSPSPDPQLGYLDFQEPPSGEERRILEKVSAVCIPASSRESLDVGRPVVFTDDDEF